MTRKLPQSQLRARRVLGAELRRLREHAGLRGAAVADAIGKSASSVSLIEDGKRAVTREQVQAWLLAVLGVVPDALSADDSKRIEQLTATATATGISPLSGSFAARQAEVAALEDAATAIRNWQPSYVAGLLQTPDYARAVFSMLKAPEQVDDAVDGRITRQAILRDSSRQFEFITTEQGLSWRPEGPDLRPAQFDWIASVAALRHVAVRVIPVGAVMYVPPVGPFTLYEWESGGLVTIELPGDRGRIPEIESYQDDLEALRRSALSGDDAIAFIRDMARQIAVAH